MNENFKFQTLRLVQEFRDVKLELRSMIRC